MAKKNTAKSFALQRRKRRQWITFTRMIRYGINNFSRNAWLTIAATAVMTITLLIVFMTFSARSTLQSTIDSVRDKVDVSVYILGDTEQTRVNEIMSGIESLDSVNKVSYISSEEARKRFAEKNSTDSGLLNALNEATNEFPGTIRVNLIDLEKTKELEDYIATNTVVQESIDPDRPPSSTGSQREVINNIGKWVGFADRAGLVASLIFVIISSLIVFNTIRMAIYNRKEEIQMMKLIGADRSFIRGPFIVEAVVYGFIAAVLATGLGFMALYSMREKLLSYEVAIQPTIDFLTSYVGFVLLAMITMGALIGVVSSLMATRRYLKI